MYIMNKKNNYIHIYKEIKITKIVNKESMYLLLTKMIK